MIPKQFVCQALLKIFLTNKLSEICKSSICFRVILLNFSYSLQLFMPIICLLICSFRNITYKVTFWPLKETGYDQNFTWNIQNLQQHVPIFGDICTCSNHISEFFQHFDTRHSLSTWKDLYLNVWSSIPVLGLLFDS